VPKIAKRKPLKYLLTEREIFMYTMKIEQEKI